MRMRVTGRHEHVETVVAVYHERHESRIEVQRMQAHKREAAKKARTTHGPCCLTSIPSTTTSHNDTEFPAIRKLILPPTGMQ